MGVMVDTLLRGLPGHPSEDDRICKSQAHVICNRGLPGHPSEDDRICKSQAHVICELCF
ncbi:MAG: hypothetical protein ACI9SP_004853 [Arenicella sp.]|jgi:hypothetical protein